MARLKAKLAKADWEKLSESERALYVAIDNGAAYVPDVESVDGWGLENIHGLKSAVDKLRDEKAALERKIRDGGATPELERQLAETKAELDALRKSDPEGKANARLKAAEQEWKSKFDTNTQEFAAREARLKSALDKGLRDVKLQTALAEKKVRPERLPYVARLLESRVRMVEREDGEWVPMVVGDDGKPAYSKRTGRLTEPMGLDELAEEASRTLPEMFQGHEASGTGATHSRSTSGGGRFTLSEAEASDPQAYRARRAEAMKAGTTVSIDRS